MERRADLRARIAGAARCGSARWGLMAAAVVLLLSPLLVLALAAVFYAASLLARARQLAEPVRVADGALSTARSTSLFSPPILPTIMPRAARAGPAGRAGACSSSRRSGRAASERSRRGCRARSGGGSSARRSTPTEPAATLVDALWSLVRGASSAPEPAPGRDRPPLCGRAGRESRSARLSRSAGRRARPGRAPGPRRRAVVAAIARGRFEARRRRRRARARPRSSTSSGPQRDLVVDFLEGALRLPVASAPARRRSSRPTATGAANCIASATGRSWPCGCSTESAAVGVEQVILVSAAPPAGGAARHCAPAVGPARPDGRARAIDRDRRVRGRVDAGGRATSPACSSSGRITIRSGRSISAASMTRRPTAAAGPANCCSRATRTPTGSSSSRSSARRANGWKHSRS